MIEWGAPAVVLRARPFGEADALASVLTANHGRYCGLVRGGGSRGRVGTWQSGNLVAARWVARLADQLGTISGELVHPGAALAMADPLALAVLSAACAVAEAALPERAAHRRVFEGLVTLIAGVTQGAATALSLLVRWEIGLLADLGFGLDLDGCAVLGAAAPVAFVSPRTGRGVSEMAAGVWKSRLLRLPAFVYGEPDRAQPSDWVDGLALTGYFLKRDLFGSLDHCLPQARALLYDQLRERAERLV